jgi:hypothetical protein
VVMLSIAAKEAGYSTERLRQFIRDGMLAGEQQGRFWLVKMSDVRRLMQTYQPTTGRPRGSRNRKQPTPPHASG